MKKAFVFDMDGTLVNSVYDIGDSVNYLLAQRGLPLRTYEEYLSFLGMGLGVTLSKAMPGYDKLPKEEQEEMRKAFIIHNTEHCLDKTLPYEGISETLIALTAKNAVLGIFSNRPEILAIKISNVLFKDSPFAFVLGAKENVSMKPNPQRVLAELEKLGIQAADTVFIGDGKPDIETGKNGGMYTVGVSWGYKGLEEIDGADMIIYHARQLLDIV